MNVLISNTIISGVFVYPALIIVIREILVSGMREYLAELKVKISLPVNYLAKIKTSTQMIAIIILLLDISS